MDRRLTALYKQREMLNRKLDEGNCIDVPDIFDTQKRLEELNAIIQEKELQYKTFLEWD